MHQAGRAFHMMATPDLCTDQQRDAYISRPLRPANTKQEPLHNGINIFCCAHTRVIHIEETRCHPYNERYKFHKCSFYCSAVLHKQLTRAWKTGLDLQV